MRTRLLTVIGAAALLAAVVPSAFGADPVYATVTGYADGSAANNNVDTWEKETGLECTKTADGAQLGDTYLLTSDYALVIVKAGSEASAPGFTNTLFADASAGETVWADSNGDGIFNEGDKGISHIIFCGPSSEESESPSSSVPPEESESPSSSVPPEESESPSASVPPEESESPSSSVPPEESEEPSGSVGTETDVPSTPPSDGGVEGETDVPDAPSTDIDGNTAGPGSSLPILLIVLGIIGLAAVVLTPARKRR